MFSLIQTVFQLESGLHWGSPTGRFAVFLFIVSVCVLGGAVGCKIQVQMW